MPKKKEKIIHRVTSRKGVARGLIKAEQWGVTPLSSTGGRKKAGPGNMVKEKWRRKRKVE